jgi:hypothetical protein
MQKIYQKPKRRFENSGLVIPGDSFHVNLENVTNTENEDIWTMVDKGRYFTIFAQRQSGKTTFFYDFCRSIETDPFYITILLSFQSYQMNGTQFWFDENLNTGTNWSLEIQNAIETASLTVCILTNSFLTSEFIQKREIPEIQLRQQQGMIVFPILAEDCLWNIVKWLKTIQIYPKDGIALESLDEKALNEKLMDVVREINDILDS